MAGHASAQLSCAPRAVTFQSRGVPALVRAPSRPLGAAASSRSTQHATFRAWSVRAPLLGGCAAQRLLTSTAGRPHSPRVAAASSSAGGDTHGGAAEASSGVHECALCGVRASSAAQLQPHLLGRRHAKAERRANAPAFAAQAGALLEDLEHMNGWLVRLGHEEAESKTAARRELRKIHINIYDLVENRLEPVFETIPELRKYSVKQGKVFYREAAKEEGLRNFLRRFF